MAPRRLESDKNLSKSAQNLLGSAQDLLGPATEFQTSPSVRCFLQNHRETNDLKPCQIEIWDISIGPARGGNAAQLCAHVAPVAATRPNFAAHVAPVAATRPNFAAHVNQHMLLIARGCIGSLSI